MTKVQTEETLRSFKKNKQCFTLKLIVLLFKKRHSI